MPAVVTVKEGINLPRYPSVPGRLRAKRKPLQTLTPGPGRPAARAGPPGAARGDRQAGPGAGQRPRRRARSGRGPQRGGRAVTVLAYVEDPADELSQQALALAQTIDSDVAAVTVAGDAYAPAAWGATLAETIADRARHRRWSLPGPTAATSCWPTWPRSSISRWPQTALGRARGSRHRDPDPLGRQPARGGAGARLSVAPHQRPPRGRGGPDRRRRDDRRRPGRPASPHDRAAHRTKAGRLRRRVARRRRRGRVRRSRGRLGRGVLDHRGARGPARRRRRLLARRDQRRLAPAHRPGRPDRYEDLARDLHRLRDQRRHPAHGRLQGRQEAAGDQSRTARRRSSPAPTTR